MLLAKHASFYLVFTPNLHLRWHTVCTRVSWLRATLAAMVARFGVRAVALDGPISQWKLYWGVVSARSQEVVEGRLARTILVTVLLLCPP